MLHIVGVIIICKEAAAAVKTLHKHALPIHVREAQRAVDGGAAQLTRPVLHHAEQGGRHLPVVDKVHLREAQTVGAPLLVGLAAENGADAPHDLLPPHGQPAASLAVGKGGILAFVPVLQIVAIGGGDELGHVFV